MRSEACIRARSASTVVAVPPSEAAEGRGLATTAHTSATSKAERLVMRLFLLAGSSLPCPPNFVRIPRPFLDHLQGWAAAAIQMKPKIAALLPVLRSSPKTAPYSLRYTSTLVPLTLQEFPRYRHPGAWVSGF